MNLVKTLKSAAAISAVALSFVSAPSFATVGLHADASLGVKTCRNGSECTDPNGPSLDGFAGTASQAPSIRTCTKTTAECADPNGPSLDGLVDPKLGTVISATDPVPRSRRMKKPALSAGSMISRGPVG
ncbi:hypothetical protein DFR24_1381 [Panacagrimonas perspica]|uniref:Uncharacterized protein n=1 Tax=Panacagrimonas perspica TaxID=381431 RepID=A0A4S3K892_9GAMM|nr:hypothetical protein [Panacagrimonas perspica]TDU31996.1 hypothetical protein DFR24_1381 [Panacagrimonas perspica]THD04467.1 hypothetical protein B1810_05565 [Panacagrimonas perspica]